MTTIDDVMKAPISLHGLGFLQIKLGANQRMHIWHPDLPRRSCFEHSQVHDHRFGFESRILVGEQTNKIFSFRQIDPLSSAEAVTHHAYRHEGARLPTGGRPWVLDTSGILDVVSTEHNRPGSVYHMLPYVFHESAPLRDGRVATVMRKTAEHEKGARSLCRPHIAPDEHFDRYQLSVAQMWEVVEDVLTQGYRGEEG